MTRSTYPFMHIYVYNDLYSNTYISWWVYFVTGLRYVLQQPSTAGLAKTKTDIAKKELLFLLVSVWQTNISTSYHLREMCCQNYLKERFLRSEVTKTGNLTQKTFSWCRKTVLNKLINIRYASVQQKVSEISFIYFYFFHSKVVKSEKPYICSF